MAKVERMVYKTVVPAGSTENEYQFNIPPGFYTSIYLYSFQNPNRGAHTLTMNSTSRDSAYMYFGIKTPSTAYDYVSWVLQNVTVDFDTFFNIKFLTAVAADVIEYGYYASSDRGK